MCEFKTLLMARQDFTIHQLMILAGPRFLCHFSIRGRLINVNYSDEKAIFNTPVLHKCAQLYVEKKKKILIKTDTDASLKGGVSMAWLG